MPILKSAVKKLKQDKHRARANAVYRAAYKKALKAARAKKSAALVTKAFQALDRAAKKQVIHKNKASRLKSRLAQILK
jgi:small subunit ribosomal protein S20